MPCCGNKSSLHCKFQRLYWPLLYPHHPAQCLAYRRPSNICWMNERMNEWWIPSSSDVIPIFTSRWHLILGPKEPSRNGQRGQPGQEPLTRIDLGRESPLTRLPLNQPHPQLTWSGWLERQKNSPFIKAAENKSGQGAKPSMWYPVSICIQQVLVGGTQPMFLHTCAHLCTAWLRWPSA